MWYEKYISPRADDSMVFQRGYKVGAALALGLPRDSFFGLTYEKWGEFFQDWKENMEQDYLPYELEAIRVV